MALERDQRDSAQGESSRNSLFSDEPIRPAQSARSFKPPKLSQLVEAGQSLQKTLKMKIREPEKTEEDKDKGIGNAMAHPLMDWLTKDVKKRLVAIDRKLDLLPAIERKLERVCECLASQPRQVGSPPASEAPSTIRALSESRFDSGSRQSISPAKFRRRSQSVPHINWHPTHAPLDNVSECGSRRASKRTNASECGSMNGDLTGYSRAYSGNSVSIDKQCGETSSPKHSIDFRSSGRHNSGKSEKRLVFGGSSGSSIQAILDTHSLIAKSPSKINAIAAVVPCDLSPEPSASGESSGSGAATAVKASVVSHRSMGAGSQRIWNFLEDPNSSMCAFLYASTIPVLIMMSVFASLLQTTEPPILSGVGPAVTETCIDCIFAVEISLRFIVCPSRVTFFFSTQNLIDIMVALPLILRAIIGFEIPPSAEIGWEREFLLCVVPMLRLLKMMHRFEKFHLLLKAMEICAEALPVMLFTLLVIAWSFSSLIYFVEPRSNIDSLPRAMWLTIVTMTTVGYGDVTPESSGGSIIVAMLVISSVLYMAMPIGIIGHAFTQIWINRDQILLTHRTRDIFNKWGYTANDISKLFRLFDEDGNGKLSLSEFRKMIDVMSIGLSDKRVVQLFEAFEDKAQQGIIDERTFVRMLFPSSFHELYSQEKSRRVSWLPFMNGEIDDEYERRLQIEEEEVPSVGAHCVDEEEESLNSDAAENESVRSPVSKP